MTFKYVILLTIGALGVHSGDISVAPAAPVLARLEDFDAVPRYSFAYDVQDAITGDSKAQYETRDGDVVQGSYSLIEADGTRRIVDYTADPINGFNAVVNREPAIAVAPVVAKAAVAAAPFAARNVVAAASPVVAARSIVPASPVVAPVAARSAVVAAPLAYTLPRAVATRLSSPFAAPVAYAAGPAFL